MAELPKNLRRAGIVAGIVLAVMFCLLFVLPVVFSLLFWLLQTERLVVVNDTQSPHTITTLTQSHDDGTLFQLTYKELGAGKGARLQTGFDNVRCLGVQGEGRILFNGASPDEVPQSELTTVRTTKNLLWDDVHIYTVNLSTIIENTETSPCPFIATAEPIPLVTEDPESFKTIYEVCADPTTGARIYVASWCGDDSCFALVFDENGKQIEKTPEFGPGAMVYEEYPKTPIENCVRTTQTYFEKYVPPRSQ